MKKEEILEKSRRENKNKDVAELEVIYRASKIAATVGMLICMTIAACDWFLTKTINCASWTVNFGILSTMFICKYIKLKKSHELILAIFYILCFAFFCYGYIFNLVRAAV